MFTRCPNCDTLFRVTAAMLAAAQGDVRCGRCNAEFNALAYLGDDPDVAAPASRREPAAEHVPTTEPTPAANPLVAEPSGSLEFDVPEGKWSEFFDDTHGLPSGESAAAEERPQTGPDFEIRSLPNEEPTAVVNVAGDFSALDDETSDTDTWQAFLREVPLPEDEDADAPVVVVETAPAPQESVAADPSAEYIGIETVVPEETPAPALSPWTPSELIPAAPLQAERSTPQDAPAQDPAEDDYPSVLNWGERLPAGRERPRGSAWWVAAGLALVLALGAQLLHANRDTLATDPQFGATVRELYSRLGLPLYPAWPLVAYEMRGAEAIAGRTAPGALDVVADIAMVGNQPAAAPLVRVVLRDRWSNIVGSRILKPAEYSRDPQLRWKLLAPGSLIPVQFSLADPGASAQGYELDLCLPDRRTGLHCQLAHDPYRR